MKLGTDYRLDSKYRYVLLKDIAFYVDISPNHGVYIVNQNPKACGKIMTALSIKGELSLAAGYAWDGPTGPVRHTPDFMRGSLIHDALYQLMQCKKLPTKHRKQADVELYNACRIDGMSEFKATIVYYAVRLFGWLYI